MLKEAVLSVFTVLIFLGIVSIFYYAALKILHPKSESNYIILIAADKNKSHIADIMNSEKMRLELLNDRGIVVAVDYGMDEKEKQICNSLCESKSGMYVVAPDKINELISKRGFIDAGT